ncbi:aminodeoxychorismate/anthranilate synthase component II [Candidatus Gottesmanbacteria bacterium CG11_big_fil_rev_8_21_14_0_20_37_11]|uniref:Aminodeoxychorismate/anthranilate synthase component II n=3 Tax=Candidatus Gottesmaniibacteriota TaxID=1752720 RepID=A0A2M7RSC5_9BACT|nr:MAG: aminodeoxychorismate/anthranilate synthase component II [Candidatus Gottesmanbacteria bacterium CG1_02_37_22]PIP33015.1 MAG: aminodeoxychorismate/anthranilate synthase component II [Candidatus Gottesmanbacteria bacterium CG23_combo_of_CG06-09_8_20_14_all_37_19]PIR07655.1 MAG: aminodeoxychorismate/anthranilate synthase component II [Candidatus Gottesmanbacteria bacterium CG11_big_fil_rev_8_21_14_0_20_37_11]PIZ02939.1 MAG: aminodeoxychorismate/anthranilate synthase component II [Candidatus
MKTLIIDNYDSFTYNLYQYIGELGGNPQVHRNDKLTINKVKSNCYSHIVISPGPGNPTDPKYFGICKEVILTFGKVVPILGVCLGHQGIISCFGGKIVRASQIKHGKTSIIQHNQKGIFADVKNPLVGMRYHSLMGEQESLPDNIKVTATSLDDQAIMGVKHKKYPIFGIQFHPESIGTEDGFKILQNFLEV